MCGLSVSLLRVTDARHNTWMISSIPILPSGDVPTIFVSRWTDCDNHAASPFYGHCYTEFDNFGEGDLEYMSTSVDGGQTWSIPVTPLGHPKGLGGQPVVQPDGTVIVPFESLRGTIASFQSDDGGASWSRETTISKINFHPNAGDLRTSPLPSAEIAADGTVYVAWEDCRFEPRCTANDIVFSRS